MTPMLIIVLSAIFTFFGSVILYYVARIDKKLDTMNHTLTEKGEAIARHDKELEGMDKRLEVVEREITEIYKEHYKNVGTCRLVNRD